MALSSPMGSHQLPRLPGLALAHGKHPGIVGIPLGHGDQFSVGAVDTVTQGSKFPGIRVIPGHCADARDPLLQIHTQFWPIRRDPWLKGQRLFPASPAHR